MKKLLEYALLLTVLSAAACGGAAPSKAGNNAGLPARKVLAERWISPCTPADNIDSPAFWSAPDGAVRVIATAKATDVLVMYDAADGRELKRAGTTGDSLGQMRRPNGVAVIGDLAIVVERDNHRIQVFQLPDFTPLGFFGAGELRKPYGLYVLPADSGYRLYVTDNYEMPDESLPPDSLLGERVKLYSFRVEGGSVSASLVKSFGATGGEGVLHVVESIFADPSAGVLLLADEDDRFNDIKVYDLEGNFSGRVIGKGLFRYEPEGIGLYETPDGGGFWVMTDQDKLDNTYRVFSRRDFSYLGAFGGEVTANTDGIAVTSRAFGVCPEGGIVAVHDDCAVSAFDWREISAALRLDSLSTGGK